MMHREEIVEALQAIANARREAQTELDRVVEQKLAISAPPEHEEGEQALGALVRQLENARRELAAAVRSCDQLERVNRREHRAGPSVETRTP